MRGDILNGLRHALLGCREGDIVEAYMTYNMAYGDKYVSTIPRESPVAWFSRSKAWSTTNRQNTEFIELYNKI